METDLFYEQIAMCDSFYENEIRIQHIKENGVSTDDGGAKLPSDSRNTQSNCRMINWDNILPFPMNSYSAEDRYWCFCAFDSKLY